VLNAPLLSTGQTTTF